MTIARALEALPHGPAVVTIGTFDGVHRGHRRLLDGTVARARELGVRAVVITFEPIPAQVLRPDLFPGRIATAEEKLAMIAASAPDAIVALTFDRNFSLQTADEFMQRLVRALDVREVWVGEAFALGRDRSGNVERLRDLGADLGYQLRAMPRIEANGEVISSSAIRAAVQGGDVVKAERLLGRPFRVAGVVIHGAHLGRTIGFPTANVEPPADHVALADGIYASLTTLPEERTPRWSMTYVGTRPTVNTGARLIETNVLDFDGDLYGRRIAVDLIARLRPDEHFPSLEAMIAQLGRDEAATRALLGARVAGLTD
jgi:riboflavin kinase/FMN adenylyltransferase